MATSYGSERRTFQRRDRRTITERLSTRDVTEEIREALAPVPVKVLAEGSGSSLRAAENAKQGVNSMCLAYFFNAARHIPELHDLALKWLGAENRQHPDILRAVDLIMNAKPRAAQRLGGAGDV